MSRKGENIFKRKDGRWEARFIHHYENGKAKYRYLYGSTYTEVKAKKQMELSLPENAKRPAVKQLGTFDTLANLWLADVKISVKESTYTRYYRIVIKYLFPLLKNQILSKIDRQFLNQLPEQLLTMGGVNQSALSPKTVSDIICILKRILQYARDNDYPCPNISSLKLPQKAQTNIRILNEADRMNIEKKLMMSEDTTSLGILFTLFTGVRIGELCGLRWEDIDFQNSTVTVSRTVARIADLDLNTKSKTKVIISEPKTEHSVRTIPLPAFLVEYLLLRRQDNHCYLITGSKSYTEPHQYYIRYQKYLEQNNISRYSFHALRQ